MSAALATPADAMSSPRAASHEAPEHREIGAVERPVAVDGGHLEHADALVRQAVQRVRHGDADRARDPALPDGQAVANVERDGDPPGPEMPYEPSGERRVAQRGRPHHGASGAGPEARLHGALVAQAACDLDPCALPHPGDDRGHEIGLPGARIARAIEVDDVQPAGATPRRTRPRRPRRPRRRSSPPRSRPAGA